MLWTLFTSFAFLCSISLSSAEIEIQDNVLVLTTDNFDEAISTNEMILVEFYAPWCGHCKKLEPEYKKAAQALLKEPVKLAKVDATVETDLAQRFGIRGFPTLKMFKHGKPSEYGGGRTSAEIVNWLKKHTGPPAKTISTSADLTEAQESGEAVVVGFFSSADSANAKAFLAQASVDESVSYFIAHSDEIKNALAVGEDAVVVLKSFDEKRTDMTFSGDLNTDELASFVRGASIPLIQEFSQENAKKIFSSPIQQHALFFTDKLADHHAATISTFQDVASTFKGRILHVNVPSTETRVMEFFGLKEEDVPALIVADMSAEGQLKKFPYSGPMNSDDIKAFINSFLTGELKPTLKSEEPQPSDTTGDVVVLRGQTFNDLVINNDKDVLVEFYAPWCGHCKKLAPTWDELGRKFSTADNIVIAKMDATANEVDVEGLKVRGYPTIYFFKGNDKTPRLYEGGRELDDFVEFLKENTSNQFSHDEL